MTDIRRRALGRKVNHDPRSKDHAFDASTSQLRTVRHHSHIGILDQGQVGSCTGNAAVKAISHTAFWPKAKTVIGADLSVDEEYAVGVYSDAEVLDGDGPYVAGDPSTDHGSSGLSVAKVLQRRGLIASYRHAFGLQAALAAISHQTVIVGIPWYEDMFNPDAQGFIRPTGQLAGGHEICVDEIVIPADSQFGTGYVEFPNSWSASWGMAGRARITWDDFGSLLANQGDVTVFQWIVG